MPPHFQTHQSRGSMPFDLFRGCVNTGLVLGKFLPLHNGHLYLIRFAAQHVQRLYVVVESVKNEPILHQTRLSWVRSLCPNCEVISLVEHMPQRPEDSPDFWTQWRTVLEGILPEQIDFVFASERYGNPLASVLNAQFCPLDIGRIGENISGTQIRDDIYAHWSHLPHPVQCHFQSKICIVGAESVGKSTIAKSLAVHLNGRMVPEYARHYLETFERAPKLSDMPKVAFGQLCSESARSEFGDPFLICDTDPLTTLVWSHHLFGRCDDQLRHWASSVQYDLTLLLEPDVPWVADSVRYTPNDRWAFHRRLVDTLNQYKRPYEIINGDWSERLIKAKQRVHQLMDAKRLSLFWTEED